MVVGAIGERRQTDVVAQPIVDREMPRRRRREPLRRLRPSVGKRQQPDILA
jgi:hypothetical protein